MSLRPGLAASFLIFCALASPGPAADHARETPQEVQRAVNNSKAVLLDVREANEWDAGHLKIAQLVPLSSLDEMTADQVASKIPKGKVVYCHCVAGTRAAEAAGLLKKLGYDARALKPGYKELVKAGLEPARR